MKNPFSFLFRSRDKPKDSVSNAPTFSFGSSVSGKTVNPRSAVQVSAVYACVRVIAETIASLPCGIYADTETGTMKVPEHPLYHLIHDEPNPEMTSFVYREVMLSHLLLWGNSYSQIIRNERNAVIGLYPLLPDQMVVDRDSAGQLYYTYTTTEGSQVRLTPWDVLHIPGLGFDGIMGYSPVALEKNAIGLGIAAEEYGSRFFQNGARPSGILTHPNTVKDPAKLRESWNAAYGGSSNGGKVAVLEEGMTFHPISLPNNEAQFLETRKFQVEEICRIFRVPPHLIGDLERSTYSNIEHQSIDFAMHTIRPWLVRIEQSMNRALFPEAEKGRFYVQFNIDGLMRGDYQSRMQGYAIARQNGWMSANDIRALENLNPIPEELGGSLYLVNGNMLPIDLCGANAQINLAMFQLQLASLAAQAQKQAEESEESPKKSPQKRGKRQQDDDDDQRQEDEEQEEEQQKSGQEEERPDTEEQTDRSEDEESEDESDDEQSEEEESEDEAEDEQSEDKESEDDSENDESEEDESEDEKSKGKKEREKK